MRPIVFALALLVACAAPGAGAGLALNGTSWRGSGEHAPTIEFGADGRAAGSAGCNRWFATVTRAGDAGLSFSAIGTTRMMCEPPRMEIERNFTGVLGQTASARVEGDTLILLGAGGAEVARFTRAN